jgi:Maltokinase N-terminal cap domain
MALVYDATLTPSKQDLVVTWLPSRPWGRDIEVTGKAGEYRFDDPAGEVGIETILFSSSDGRVVQVPLTYRAEPLDGAEEFLVGTCDHSVLGSRWVYDGCGDPVWAATLAAAIVTGGTQAPIHIDRDGERRDIPARVQVRGSGEPGSDVPALAAIDSVSERHLVTVVRCGDVELVLPRIVGVPLEADQTLTGSWAGGEAVLAGLRRTTE